MSATDTLPVVPEKSERLGEVIRDARDALKLSQRQLGEMVGVSQNAISRLELGKIDEIPIPRIEAIAEALGTTFAVLLLRSGYIDVNLPVKELLETDQALSPRGRRVLRETYNLIREFEAQEGLTPPEQPPGDVLP